MTEKEMLVNIFSRLGGEITELYGNGMSFSSNINGFIEVYFDENGNVKEFFAYD